MLDTAKLSSNLPFNPSLINAKWPEQAAGKTFVRTIETYLKDSNAYMNTYFSRYFEWQGICRESWFYQCISPDLLQTQGVFITKSAHNNFVQETFPFQTIKCLMNSAHVRKTSFYLIFRFYNNDTDEMVSTGYQQIVFASMKRKIAKLPEDILRKIRAYEVQIN